MTLQGASPFGDPAGTGRYGIVRQLGQGGFGRVYLARDHKLDRTVAIKLPNPDRVAGPEDLECYLTEARTLAQLDHPGIVPVYDVGQTNDGLCYVVSKYIEGGDLAELLKGGPPSHRESAEIVALVAEGLHHAHIRGLVHRDIKPANILIDLQGKPCVTDFGLALKDEDFGKGPTLAGSPSYMSPEQARCEGHLVDGRSDIFSLGVVFYELLTGTRPFRGDSQTDVMNRIVTTEPRPLRQRDDTIPRELERICLTALAKRASERYNTASDMAADLRHFLQTEARPGAGDSDRLDRMAATIVPGGHPGPAHCRAVRFRWPHRQDRSEGAEIIRPPRRRLLPGAAARSPRPQRPPRGPPVLEDTDRIGRPRHRLSCGPDVRPFGLWQVIAGQGGLGAAAE